MFTHRTFKDWRVLAGVLLAHVVILTWMTTEHPLPRILPPAPMTGILLSSSSAGDSEQPRNKEEKEKKSAKRQEQQMAQPSAKNHRHEKIPAPLPADLKTDATQYPKSHVSQKTKATSGFSQNRPEGKDSGGAADTNGDANGIILPRRDAGHRNTPKPGYPPASRRLAEEGTVLLSVHIAPDGTVAEVRLKKSSGFSRLDNAAIYAVRKWRYIPALRDNTPIPFLYTQEVTFSLTD